MPFNKENNRFTCTADDPWTPEKGRSEHPDAKMLENFHISYGGEVEIDAYKCPHCGKYFEVEIAQ